MVDSPKLVLGLDLHGTLLEPGEIIRDELIEPVASGLEKIQHSIKSYICTGNDLEFVLRKVPQPILDRIDGYVLETGCSMSADGKKEEVLTRESERKTMGGLEDALKAEEFSEINYFAHRLTTISMFCDNPRDFYESVFKFVEPTEFGQLVHVTYSSVAVDILPAGYDKHKGLAAVANGAATVGVADSMNDRALLAEADYSLAPSNMAPELRPLFKDMGRPVIGLEGKNSLETGVVMVASKPETEGVIEILDFLARATDLKNHG